METYPGIEIAQKLLEQQKTINEQQAEIDRLLAEVKRLECRAQDQLIINAVYDIIHNPAMVDRLRQCAPDVIERLEKAYFTD